MILSFVAWALTALVCGLVVYKVVPALIRPVRDLLEPMWLPAAGLAAAGLALFASDQGRDLGVGLLDARYSQLILLALALFYWATANWHAARLVLNRRFGWPWHPAIWPAGYEPAMMWLPRLLGIGPHLLAASSISLAAARYQQSGGDLAPILGFLPAWLVAFVPPAVIVAGIAIVWHYEHRYRAARRALDAVRQADSALARAQVSQADRRSRLAGLEVIAVGTAAVLLLWALGDRLPAGLAAATSCVLV